MNQKNEFKPSEALAFACDLFAAKLNAEYDYKSSVQVFVKNDGQIKAGIKVDNVPVIVCGFPDDTLDVEKQLYHVLMETVLSGMDILVKEAQAKKHG